jgi:hypothetical protein
MIANRALHPWAWAPLSVHRVLTGHLGITLHLTSSSDINCDTSLAYVVIICKVAMIGASPIQSILGHLSEITFKAFTGLDCPDLKMNIS